MPARTPLQAQRSADFPLTLVQGKLDLDALPAKHLVVQMPGASEARAELEKRYPHPLLERVEHGLELRLSQSETALGLLLTLRLTAPPSPIECRWLVSNFFRKFRALFSFDALLCITRALPGNESSASFGPAFEQALADDLFNLAVALDPKVKVLLRPTGAIQEEARRDWERRSGFKRRYIDWINENPSTLTSLRIGEELRDFAKQHHLEMHTLEEKELAAEGLNLLLAVGGASVASPPRLHMVHYTPKSARAKEAPILFVGKGITFDTGGINLKHHDNFVNCMKNDMSGAALASQVFMALVEAGIDAPMHLLIPSCENSIDAKSLRPGTVLRSHQGTPVFIEHTDAEGRLILADAVSYGQKRFAPDLTVTMASLTTAALRQFTYFYTPVHFAPPALRAALTRAGDAWGENYVFWDQFLPFTYANHTKAANLTNLGSLPHKANGAGGSSVAAHFIRHFSKGAHAHFDIFASAWNWGEDYPGTHYGATGAPFNSTFAAFQSFLSQPRGAPLAGT